MRSENTVTNTINRYRSFRYALILEGVAVGAISGVVVVAFRYLLGYAEILLNSVLNYGRTHTWFVPVWFVVLAVAAIIVAMLLKWDSLISGSGIPQVEGEIMGEIDECWWRVLLAKLAGGLIGLGCGLSLGRYGGQGVFQDYEAGEDGGKASHDLRCERRFICRVQRADSGSAVLLRGDT